MARSSAWVDVRKNERSACTHEPPHLDPIAGNDPARAKRAFKAMMQMKRIDIATIERAADGLLESA